MSAEIGGFVGATIRKDVRTLAPPPNLIDYETACREFSWQRARSLLEGLPRRPRIEHRSRGGGPARKGERADRTALRWLGKAGEKRDISYRELSEATNRFANGLRKLGVGEGGRVFILLGRVPELYVSVLGALKAKCVASPLFSAFGPEPRHPSRAGRGSSPRHHAGVVSPQGGGHRAGGCPSSPMSC